MARPGSSSRRIEKIVPRVYVHHSRFTELADVDGVAPLVREAYKVGCREHLRPHAAGG